MKEKYPWLVFCTLGEDTYSSSSSDEKDLDRLSKASEKIYEYNDHEDKDDENETFKEDEEDSQVLLPKFYSLCEEEYFLQRHE